MPYRSWFSPVDLAEVDMSDSSLHHVIIRQLALWDTFMKSDR